MEVDGAPSVSFTANPKYVGEQSAWGQNLGDSQGELQPMELHSATSTSQNTQGNKKQSPTWVFIGHFMIFPSRVSSGPNQFSWRLFFWYYFVFFPVPWPCLHFRMGEEQESHFATCCGLTKPWSRKVVLFCSCLSDVRGMAHICVPGCFCSMAEPHQLAKVWKPKKPNPRTARRPRLTWHRMWAPRFLTFAKPGAVPRSSGWAVRAGWLHKWI